MADVLCTGVDNTLMRTRALILEAAGHKVTPASTEQQVIEACRVRSFRVAVIGQAMPTALKQRIFEAIRRSCPNAKVLELYHEATGRTLKAADAWLAAPVGVPTELAEAVDALIQGEAARSG